MYSSPLQIIAILSTLTSVFLLNAQAGYRQKAADSVRSAAEGTGQVEREPLPSDPSLQSQVDLDNFLDSLSLPHPARRKLRQALSSSDLEGAENILIQQLEKTNTVSRFGILTALGRIFFLDQKYLNAAIALKKAEALNRLDSNARFTLAMSYIVLKRLDWARPELEVLVSEDPRNALYLYWLARLDYDETRYQEAIQRLETVLRLDPGSVRAHDRLGLCYEALGDADRALFHFKRAVELDKTTAHTSPWPWLNLAIHMIRSNNHEPAQDLLQECIARHPDFHLAHYHLGMAQEKMGLYEAAAAALKRSIELNAAHPGSYWALSRVLRRQGDLQGSLEALARFQKLKSTEKHSQ